MTKSASKGAPDGPHHPDPDEDLPIGEPPVQKEEEGVVGQKLASELVRQQELYADLRRKTQQLKQLQQVRERERRERGWEEREGGREERERGEGKRKREGKEGERGGKGGERWEERDEREGSTCIYVYEAITIVFVFV